MKKSLIIFLSLAIVITTLWAAPTQVSALTVDFSADMTLTDVKGKISSGKVFVKSGVKIRQEILVDNVSAITILRVDKMLSWTLMPEQKQYMEIKLSAIPNAPVDTSYAQVALGTQTINGYVCDGIQYTYNDKKLGVAIIWTSARLGYAVKTETKDSKGKTTATYEIKNIKEAPQADSLFEVPAGYTKFSMQFSFPGT